MSPSLSNAAAAADAQSALLVVGVPLSTFTRTVTIALHAKDVPFQQLAAGPHSAEALQFNPLGFIPTLVDRSSASAPVVLTEAIAILRFLERRHPEPALFKLKTGDERPHERIDELCSLVATHLFPKLEHGVVKVRLAAQQEFVDEASILVSLEPGLAALRQVLVVLESKLSASGPYCLGSYFTAADAFLYPPMADLMAHPERAIVDEFDKVKKWCAFFGRHELAIKTREGTFEGGFRL